jgi:hypothetical protein
MQSFIVLGIIPGTSIQLTFNFWLYIAILLVCLPFLKALWQQRNTVRVYIVAIQISRTIDRYQLPA